MAKRLSLRKELQKELRPRLGRERNKHEDKLYDKKEHERLGENADKMNSLEKRYFYTKQTYDECVSRGQSAWKWINAQEGRRLTFDEAREKLPDYIAYRRELAMSGEITPRTLAKERSQLSKVWLVNLDDVDILPCHAESSKGRKEDAYFDMYSERNKDATEFYKMVGARKGEYRNLDTAELTKYRAQVKREYGIELRPDIHGRYSNLQPVWGEDGLVHSVVICHAKHGKSNCAEIMEHNRAALTEIFVSGKYQDYFNPSDHCNVHQCRRDYALDFYRTIKRDIEELPEREIYRTRDGTHRAYDREAVGRIAESLGHRRNDLFDTVHNYLR